MKCLYCGKTFLCRGDEIVDGEPCEKNRKECACKKCSDEKQFFTPKGLGDCYKHLKETFVFR